MSYSSRQHTMLRMSEFKALEQVSLEQGNLREAIGLAWFMVYGDERLTPEELGARIDDCLVENINGLLLDVKEEKIGLDEFKWAASIVEEGMREDPDLRAYENALLRDKQLPLASETYLRLTKRRVENGGKSQVSPKEARQLAGALLGIVRSQEWEKYDWDIETYSQFCASLWLNVRDPYELLTYIFQSHWNAAAYDTLMLICKHAAQHGREEILRLPESILRWHLGATYDMPKRPELAPAPRYRPKTLGKYHRDNEVRHAVYLLRQVCVRKMVAYDAVGKGANLAKGTVRKTCGKPYWTLTDMRLDIESHLKSDD